MIFGNGYDGPMLWQTLISLGFFASPFVVCGLLLRGLKGKL